MSTSNESSHHSSFSYDLHSFMGIFVHLPVPNTPMTHARAFYKSHTSAEPRRKQAIYLHQLPSSIIA